MTTTTSYGNWNDVHPTALTLAGEVEDSLGREYSDSEVRDITNAYRKAINEALPDSVSLCGDEFYGNAYPADCTDQADYPHDEDGDLDLAAIVDGVDFWDIVEDVAGL